MTLCCNAACCQRFTRQLAASGHERLPADGQMTARWRTAELPGGGHGSARHELIIPAWLPGGGPLPGLAGQCQLTPAVRGSAEHLLGFVQVAVGFQEAVSRPAAGQWPAAAQVRSSLSSPKKLHSRLASHSTASHQPALAASHTACSASACWPYAASRSARCHAAAPSRLRPSPGRAAGTGLGTDFAVGRRPIWITFRDSADVRWQAKSDGQLTPLPG